MATITPRQIMALEEIPGTQVPFLDTITLSIARIEGIGLNDDGTAWVQLASAHNPLYWKRYASVSLDLELLLA